MADNYLERKMEDYRNGRLATGPRRTEAARAGISDPGLKLKFPKMYVAVLAANAVTSEPFIAALRHAGISVALSCVSGGKAAAIMAQKYGTRLYPEGCEADRMIGDLNKNRIVPDFIIDLRAESGSVPGSIYLSSAARSVPSDILARQLLFLIHPDNVALLGNQTLFYIA